jgi:hypothetical protein
MLQLPIKNSDKRGNKSISKMKIIGAARNNNNDNRSIIPKVDITSLFNVLNDIIIICLNIKLPGALNNLLQDFPDQSIRKMVIRLKLA